jgi:hypothetical protein
VRSCFPPSFSTQFYIRYALLLQVIGVCVHYCKLPAGNRITRTTVPLTDSNVDHWLSPGISPETTYICRPRIQCCSCSTTVPDSENSSSTEFAKAASTDLLVNHLVNVELYMVELVCMCTDWCGEV